MDPARESRSVVQNPARELQRSLSQSSSISLQSDSVLHLFTSRTPLTTARASDCKLILWRRRSIDSHSIWPQIDLGSAPPHHVMYVQRRVRRHSRPIWGGSAPYFRSQSHDQTSVAESAVTETIDPATTSTLYSSAPRPSDTVSKSPSSSTAATVQILPANVQDPRRPQQLQLMPAATPNGTIDCGIGWNGAVPAAPVKGNVCRFCDLVFSTRSNRYRHERIKHAALLQQQDDSTSVVNGGSRTDVTLRAFAPSALTRGISLWNYVNLATPATVELLESSDEAAEEKVAESDPRPVRGLVQESSMTDDGVRFEMPDDVAPEQNCDAVQAPQGQAVEECDSPDDQPPPDDSDDIDEGSPARPSTPQQQQDLDADMKENVHGAVELVDWSQVGEVRPLLSEDQLQDACYPFLHWLTIPATTSCEALVKNRRVKSTSQMQPVKSNLKFIFALLWEIKAVELVELTAFTRLSICEALNQAVTDRRVGSGRVHALFLLVKKVLVFLASAQSTRTRQFVQASTAFESYMYVDGICADSSHERKQAARNRMVLGHDGSREAQAALASQQPKRFEVPKLWTEEKQQSPPPPPLRQLPIATAAAQVPTSSPTMSQGEFQQVTQACLAYLTREIQGRYASDATATATDPDTAADWLYTHYLVTATLCLGMAPRSQVLQQLQLGSSFVREADGQYWVKMLAAQSKNGRPT